MRLFDLHCDTLTLAMNSQKELAQNDLQLSFEKGAAYSPWLQTMAVFIPDELRGEAAWRYFCRAEAFLTVQLQKNPKIRRCTDHTDIQKLREDRAQGVLLAVEGGAVLGGQLTRVAELASFGVRMMTLTWNGANELGGGAGEPGGLTDFGREVLREMADHRIVPDISHASDPLFWDVCETFDGPLIATHSNARTVCAHRRNLTDAQFREIVHRNGLVGLNLYPEFITGNEDASMDAIYAHIAHFRELGGDRVLALGTDFDGASMPSCLPDVENLYRLADYLLGKNTEESFVNGLFFDHAADFFNKL